MNSRKLPEGWAWTDRAVNDFIEAKVSIGSIRHLLENPKYTVSLNDELVKHGKPGLSIIVNHKRQVIISIETSDPLEAKLRRAGEEARRAEERRKNLPPEPVKDTRRKARKPGPVEITQMSFRDRQKAELHRKFPHIYKKGK